MVTRLREHDFISRFTVANSNDSIANRSNGLVAIRVFDDVAFDATNAQLLQNPRRNTRRVTYGIDHHFTYEASSIWAEMVCDRYVDRKRTQWILPRCHGCSESRVNGFVHRI